MTALHNSDTTLTMQIKRVVVCDECHTELQTYEDYYKFGDYAIVCRECLLDWAKPYLRTVGDD